MDNLWSFLCFQKNCTDECYFKEGFADNFNYNLYSSYKYKGCKPSKRRKQTQQKQANRRCKDKPWYLGINDHRTLRGYNTESDMDAVRFLPKRRTEQIRDEDTLAPFPADSTTPKPYSRPFDSSGRGRGGGKRKGGKDSKTARNKQSPFSTRPGRKGGRSKCKSTFLIFPLECRRNRHKKVAHTRSSRTHRNRKRVRNRPQQE